MSDIVKVFNRFVIKYGVEGDYLTELAFHVLNGGTIDGFHEERRRASDLGHVMEDSGGGSGDTDVALLGDDVLRLRVNGK